MLAGVCRLPSSGSVDIANGCDAAAGSFTAGYVRNYQNLNAHVSGAAFPLAKAFAQVHGLRHLPLTMCAQYLWLFNSMQHTVGAIML